MSGATRPGQPAGRLRRIFDRLAPIQPDGHSEEPRQDAAAVDCTRIGDCHDRQIVTVTGTLRTVTLRPWAGAPAVEAELFDGTAPLDVVWLGRRSITGIEPGRKIIASGRIAQSRGRLVLFNPKYELRPVGQEWPVAFADKPADQQLGESRSAQDTTASKAAAHAALLEAFGGVWGMVDTTVPGLVFVAVFTVRHDITSSAVAALALTLILAIARLVRKQSLKHALSGVFGVAFGAFFAMLSGNAKNFYLPGMLYTLGLAVACVVSALVRYPLIGVLLGPILRENLSWRTRNPGRFRAYTKATWAWGLILLAKSAILFPLYWWGNATELGWVKVALRIPPLLLAVYLTWIFLAKAPPPIGDHRKGGRRGRLAG